MSNVEIDKVSVILPVADEPLHIFSQAYKSIESQSYPNLEIVVVIDRPERGDIEKWIESRLVRPYVIIKNEMPLGLAASLMRGIASAQGAFIARMDADDISEEDRIQSQLNHLRTENADLCGCFMRTIDGENREIGLMKSVPIRCDVNATKILLHGTVAYHPTWIGKADVFRRVGYRDYKFAQDIDFLRRGIGMGIKVVNLESVLLDYRLKCGEFSEHRAYYQYLVRNSDNDCDPKLIEGIAKKIPQRFTRSLKYFDRGMREKSIILKCAFVLLSCLTHKYGAQSFIGHLQRLRYIESMRKHGPS